MSDSFSVQACLKVSDHAFAEKDLEDRYHGGLKAEDKILNELVGDLNELGKLAMKSLAELAHVLDSSSSSNDLRVAYMRGIIDAGYT